MFDKYNVTFGAFFKAVLILLPASLIYVTTITPAYLGRNCLILSLFFDAMPCFCLRDTTICCDVETCGKSGYEI